MNYQIELDTIINDDTIILKGFEDWIGKKVHISVVLEKSNDIKSDEFISDKFETDKDNSGEDSFKDLRGVFAKYANPDLRKLEKNAWADSVANDYKLYENN